MNSRILAALAALTVAAVATPAGAAPAPDNLAYLLAAAGLDAVPEGTATVMIGGVPTEMTIAEAFAYAAARAGDVDLAAATLGMAPGDVLCVGDCWVLEIGSGACPVPMAVATPVPFTAYHGQFWTYPGSLGTISTSGFGIVLDWTTKGLTSGYYQNGVTIKGQSDWFCFQFFGIYIFFPFVDGAVISN